MATAMAVPITYPLVRCQTLVRRRASMVCIPEHRPVHLNSNVANQQSHHLATMLEGMEDQGRPASQSTARLGAQQCASRCPQFDDKVDGRGEGRKTRSRLRQKTGTHNTIAPLVNLSNAPKASNTFACDHDIGFSRNHQVVGVANRSLHRRGGSFRCHRRGRKRCRNDSTNEPCPHKNSPR